MALTIKPAEKYKQFARVCLWGTEKSGKTHTALMLATTLAGEGEKVGVISSEYASSKLLAHKFPHDIIDLSEADEYGTPVKGAFSPQRYEEAVKLFTQAGYKAIVIDSLSHSWAGDGGTLDAVGKAGRNSFSDGWKENTPVYDHLINTILAARCHIIVTLRAKDKYIQEEYTKRDGTKGSMPKNVGEAPVMRKAFGYEMHLTIRMDSMTALVGASAIEDHIHKGEEIEKPGPELAYRLLDALDGATPPERKISPDTLNALFARGKKMSLFNNVDEFTDFLSSQLHLEVETPRELTEEQAKDVEAEIAKRERQASSNIREVKQNKAS